MFDERQPRASETVTAARGSLIEMTGEPRPVLRLENGHRLKFTAASGSRVEAKRRSRRLADFVTADTPLGQHFRQDIFRPRGEDERELTLPELYRPA